LQGICDRSDAKRADREAIFAEVLGLFEDYPFLRCQAYLQDAGAAPDRLPVVPNNIFVQFMSRQLLLLAMAAQPGRDATAERRRLARSLFPASANGRAGARLLERHGVLFAGFGVRADVNPRLHQVPLMVSGWKSAAGPRHGGGLFDYGYFTTDYLEEAENLLDLVPAHLVSGGGTCKPLTTITCHGYYYIYELEDFAPRCYAQEAGAYGWLGHLHGQNLNVFGPGTVRFADQIGKLSFRTRSLSDGPVETVAVHPALTVLAHELTHYLHTTVAQHRPDYAQRLDRILALGARERSNIRAIDGELKNFAGSGTPAYEWFRKMPQEAVATVANVLFVDPRAVLKWCESISQGDEGVIAPLNHLLWFMDVLSLDNTFRETEKTVMLTLQPTGDHFARLDCRIKRDLQGRIETLTLPGNELRFRYDPNGFARVATK
jgi:hypothetical protein